MAEMSFLLFSLLILSLSSHSLCSTTILKVSEILSNSDHFSMSLTLKLAAKTLDLRSSSATVFAPSDFAFLRSGQPPLAVLRRHISPVRLSLQTLKALPCGSRIPTLLPNHSLLVTSTQSPSSNGFISIENVMIDEKAMIEGSSVVVYGIDVFFNSSFKNIPKQIDDGGESFTSVARFLRKRGYSIIAAFLDVQLMEFGKVNGTKLTVFAPSDGDFMEFVRNISDYSGIFRRHVVPILLPWKDLVGSEFGTKLQTFSRGFEIHVTEVNGVPMLNDSPIVAQDLYRTNWLVVHGIHGLIKALNFTDQEESTAGSLS